LPTAQTADHRFGTFSTLMTNTTTISTVTGSELPVQAQPQ